MRRALFSIPLLKCFLPHCHQAGELEDLQTAAGQSSCTPWTAGHTPFSSGFQFAIQRRALRAGSGQELHEGLPRHAGAAPGSQLGQGCCLPLPDSPSGAGSFSSSAVWCRLSSVKQVSCLLTALSTSSSCSTLTWPLCELSPSSVH